MVSRFICEVIEDMRKCHEHRNYSYLDALIEEVQYLANRMEAALREEKNYQKIHSQVQKEEAVYKELLEKINSLRKELDEEPDLDFDMDLDTDMD